MSLLASVLNNEYNNFFIKKFSRNYNISNLLTFLN